MYKSIVPLFFSALGLLAFTGCGGPDKIDQRSSHGHNDHTDHADVHREHSDHAHDDHGHGDGDGHGHGDHGYGDIAGLAFDAATLLYEGEEHFANVRQLTDGGENAEAYWSFDESALSLQVTNKAEGINCDRIYYMDVEGEGMPALNQVSNGLGRTTCAYFLPGDERVVFASTHSGSDDCPPEPDRSEGYVWPLYPDFELYVADRDGSNSVQLTDNDYYDAEATVSPNGDRMVFTSTRDGDIELYTCNLDGSDVVRITHDAGYDGGAFFSPDGSKLVFRASRFEDDPEGLKEYEELLERNLVKPTEMEVYVCDVDGSNMTKVTDLGGANWAPYFHPNGEQIIFSSNHHTGGFPFNLFMINLDGSGLKQITYDNAFDSFAMFNKEGTKLVWSSNRNNGGSRDTNVFLADWKD